MNKNIETFINTIKINDDICIANASIHQLEYTIIYMVELVDIKKFDLQVKPLITKESFNHLSDLFGGLCKNISDISTTNLEFLLYSGKILVFFDSYFYSFEFSNKPKRSISTSKIDPEDPMASQDGLIEDLNVNLTLIKRRLKTSDLRVNKYQLGLISKTECAILYLQSSYDKYSLELVLSKLRTMKNEIVTSIDDINILQATYEAMREAIDIALFGTNVQCNFKNLPDHLILEDMILEKAVAGKNITEYPTCIIYRDDTEYKRYSNSVTWEELRNDINYLTGDEPTRQTNNIFVEAFIDEHDCITRAKCADAIAWMWKYQNTKVEYIQTNIDNPNKFAIVIKDSWRTYATYVYSDSLTTEMIKNTLLRVPNTIKEAVKNNAIVL